MKTNTVPDYRPSIHGFAFPNWFPSGTPLLTLPSPFGPLPIGDASGGLCGGMVFTSLDHFLERRSLPREPTSDVVAHLARRAMDSFNLPFGVLKYYDWQTRPNASRTLNGLVVRSGIVSLTLEQEWPKIQRQLDSGLPAPLGVVQVHSYSPRELVRNHQVLAYGYEWKPGQRLTLAIYDPNYPGEDDLTLTVDATRPEGGAPILHSREGPTVRGVFLTSYRAAAFAFQ